MYLMKELSGAAFAQIGRELGGRDHSTVLYGHDKIAREVEVDDVLRRDVLQIKGAIYTATHSRVGQPVKN